MMASRTRSSIGSFVTLFSRSGSGRAYTTTRWRSGPRERSSGPARGDDVVNLQKEEVIEVVVDEQSREHHRVEREVVLLGKVAAEGPEQHVRAEDEQVGDRGAQGEQEAHPVEAAPAPRDPRHVLGADETPIRPHLVEVEHDREVLEGVPGVQALEGHVEVRQRWRDEEEHRREAHVQRLGDVQEPDPPLPDRLDDEGDAKEEEARGGERTEPLELEELREEERPPARLEAVAREVVAEDNERRPGELEGGYRVEARHEQAVVYDPRDEVAPGEVRGSAPRVLEAVGVGDVGRLVDDVHRSPEEEDSDQQGKVDDRERHDQNRHEQGPPGVAPVALPE